LFLLNDGKGRFTETTRGISPEIAYRLTVEPSGPGLDVQGTGSNGAFDLDGDGRPDLVTGSYSGPDPLTNKRTLRFYRQSPDGSFLEASRQEVPSGIAGVGYCGGSTADCGGRGLGVAGIKGADLNGDGRVDVVVYWEGYGPGYIEILRNDGDFRFTDVTMDWFGTYDTAVIVNGLKWSAHQIELKDVNADGFVDVVFQGFIETPGLLWNGGGFAFLNDGTGHFKPWTYRTADPSATYDQLERALGNTSCDRDFDGPFLVDVTGDGVPDLVLRDKLSIFTPDVPHREETLILHVFPATIGSTGLSASFETRPGSPAAGSAARFTDTSIGDPESFVWAFGDGTTSTVQNPSHTYTTPGKHSVSLRVTKGSVSTKSTRVITVGPAVAGPSTSTLFVPIVLSAGGKKGSFFTSEMTVTNRGAGQATVAYQYVAAFGGGSGFGSDSVGPGRQLIIPDAIGYLKGKGVPIPETIPRGGTLFVTFSGLADPGDGAVTIRTTTPVPDGVEAGSAGLAYAGVPAERLLNGPSYICGLRQSPGDRSNVAVQNAGRPEDGPITLRLSVFSGDPLSATAAAVQDVPLAPGGFAQYALADLVPSLTNGYVRVERISGAAPFYGYGVINDNVNSDGSFVLPVAENDLGGIAGLTLPVVVESAPFSTELMMVNLSDRDMYFPITYLSGAVEGGSTARWIFLAPGQQLLQPDIVGFMRNTGTGIGSQGPSFVGALYVTFPCRSTKGLYVGARTSNPGGGGRYGLFYPAVPYQGASHTPAWLYGLQQNAVTRTNLALVNTGEFDSSDDRFRIEVFDGDTGGKAGEATQPVPRGQFVQVNSLLSTVAPGTANAYARITRTTGHNPFIAYAVINDGGRPGERSGDGAFVAMDPE